MTDDGTGAAAVAPVTDAPAGGHRALAGALLVVAAAALWATFGIFAKRLYAAGFTPLELASVRTFVAFFAVLVFAIAVRAPLRVTRGNLVFLAAYGIVGFALFEVVFLAALEDLPVTVGAALLYTAPAFVVLIARFTLAEPVDAGRLAALALVLVGVVLVTGAARTLAGEGSTLPVRGIVLGLGAGLSYAIYTVFSKAAMQRTSPLVALVWSFGAASLVLAVLAPPFEPLARQPAALPLLIGLGLVPTLLPYALFLRALRWLRASAASMIASVEPVIAAALAVLLLGERPLPEQGIGILCIVVAAALTERKAARSEQGESRPA